MSFNTINAARYTEIISLIRFPVRFVFNYTFEIMGIPVGSTFRIVRVSIIRHLLLSDISFYYSFLFPLKKDAYALLCDLITHLGTSLQASIPVEHEVLC